MLLKRCSKCREIKPISNFNKDNNSKEGVQRYCKSCNYEYNKKWVQENHHRNQITNAKSSSKYRNLGFNLLVNNPYPSDIPVDYHHINDSDVVPIIRTLHNHYRNDHIEKLEKYVKAIYPNLK